MGTVYKKSFTKPMPADAELFTRVGQRFARWTDAKGKARKALVTASKDGQARLQIQARTYTAKYRDGSGIVREVATGCRDETAARGVLADLERRAELVKAKVISSSEDAVANSQGAPLADHLDAYVQHLEAKGVTTKHISETRRAIKTVINDCGFSAFSDLSREPFERWLVQKMRADMSARTRNAYRESMVVFVNWCVFTNRVLTNPFVAIAKANQKADPRRQRRSMNEPELIRLLDVARQRPLLDAKTIRRGRRRGEMAANLRARPYATWNGSAENERSPTRRLS